MLKKLTISIFVIGIIFVFLAYNYDKSEELDQKLTMSHCLVLGVAKELNNYFKAHGKYPDIKEWSVYILSTGYPESTGCGYSQESNLKIISDADGMELIYEYISSREANLYSMEVRREYGRSLSLRDGVVEYKNKFKP